MRSNTRPIPPGLDVEVLREFPRGQFSHVLFDFDGTISLLREGWQGIMAPVMIEMITGGGSPTPEIEREVAEYIEESTGVQTIVQMEALVEMVRKHGRVPESAIRDARGYKAIYNARLMEPVQARLDRLSSGELSVEHVTLRGVIPFIRELRARDLTLYIFSGTDRTDVVREAGVLGVAEYFEEIWGALGSLEDYSKEKVLQELMAGRALGGEQVLVIGDGPVELRNARSLGCIALGVCSDERRGWGWDDHKRERLLKTKPHLLVADFGAYEALADWLFGPPA